MKAFIVDGSKRSFADVILENKTTGKTCSVASWGFGAAQVRRLIREFQRVLLVADASHSQLNASAYAAVLRMQKTYAHFTFRPCKTHVKLALIDDEIIIFTSANLSANKRAESYIVGELSEIDGIDQIKEFIGEPEKIFRVDDGFFDLGKELQFNILTFGDA